METSTIIKNLLKAESISATRSKHVESKVKIVSTKELAAKTNGKMRKSSAQKEVEPLTWHALLIIFFSLIQTIGLLILLRMIWQAGLNVLLTLGISTGLFLMFFRLLYLLLKSGTQHNLLKLSRNGITAGDFFLRWNQVAGSLIIKLPCGTPHKLYLVLVTHDNFFIKINLREFLISSRKLAILMEAYK